MNQLVETDTKMETRQKKSLGYFSGAEAVIKSLLAEEVDTIFGYPGGTIMPVFDALYDYRDKLNHILVRHEQGAVHAAQGYARASGKIGVCIVTSGPGSTNTVTGLADALLDSTPLVVISGQVGSSLLGTDAFQETNFIGITQTVTKWNCQVKRAADIPEALAKAFYIAGSGRPGPVVVDITKDAQQEMSDFYYEKISYIRSYRPNQECAEDKIREAAELINTAKRPMVLIGQGVILGKAEDELLDFLKKSGMPAASTLLGLSAIPSTHPQYVGMLGMHGNYAPNIKNDACDLLIAIGMRFDDRVTSDVSSFGVNAKVIHIEIDPAEINKIIRADVPLLGNVREILPRLTAMIAKKSYPEWLQEFLEAYAVEYKEVIENELYPSTPEITMGEVVRRVMKAYDRDVLVVTDVGQQQMIASRYSGFKRSRSLITSGGLGTMGFGLPAAIGAKIGAPEREVCLFTGDGGFQMNIQELCTILQSRIPVKIILLNNSFLGMVRQWQELFFDKRYSFTSMVNPDFGLLAAANGISYTCVEERKELEAGIDRMKESDTAFLLEVRVAPEGNVFPMVPAGAAVRDIRLK